MRNFPWIFVILAGFSGSAAAQTLHEPGWEVAGTAAYAGIRPNAQPSGFGDDRFASGRLGVSIARYWTTHLKTELEAATGSEGTIWRQEFRILPGSTQPVPFGVEERHQLDQFAARAVWQFRDNEWIHPYVSAGVVVDRDRQRDYPQFPSRDATATTSYRGGVTAAAGAKMFVTPRAFFNTGAVWSYARPVTTFGLLAGFGMEF